MYVMNEAEAELVAALRSGKYTQANGQLIVPKETHTSHCCLGVACDIFKTGQWDGIKYVERSGSRGYDSSEVRLTNGVQNLLRWSFVFGILSFTDRGDMSVTLAVANDIGCTFDQIADLIEHGLVEHE